MGAWMIRILQSKNTCGNTILFTSLCALVYTAICLLVQQGETHIVQVVAVCAGLLGHNRSILRGYVSLMSSHVFSNTNDLYRDLRKCKSGCPLIMSCTANFVNS